MEFRLEETPDNMDEAHREELARRLQLAVMDLMQYTRSCGFMLRLPGGAEPVFIAVGTAPAVYNMVTNVDAFEDKSAGEPDASALVH